MCKKVLTFGAEALTLAETTLRLKRWLIVGLALCPYGQSARHAHRDIDARTDCEAGLPLEQLDAALLAGWLEFERKFSSSVDAN